MSTPAVTQMLDVMEARFANITTANGYFTDSPRVERARLKPFVSGDLPALTYWAGPDTFAEGGAGFERREVALFVEYHTKTRDRPFTDVADELAADVWIALWRAVGAPAVTDDPSSRLGDLVESFVLQGVVPEIGEGQAPWVGALLEIRAKYLRYPHDPFTIYD